MRLSTRVYRRLLDRRLARLDEDELPPIIDCLAGWRNRLEGQLRRLEAERRPLPDLRSFDGTSRLVASVSRADAPWRNTTVSTGTGPGMLTAEERQYYEYVGRFFSGAGAVIELGSWLGCSTTHILNGLLPNPHFAGKRLIVVDAFVWQAYMDDFYDGTDRPLPGDTFLPLFEHHTSALADRLSVRPLRLGGYPGNAPVAPLLWDEGPIELCYVDCGRTIEVNEAWFRVLAPHFLPERTLVIMQDWGLHREVPVRYDNQTKQFTDGKGAALQLVHELQQGNIGTFLFRG